MENNLYFREISLDHAALAQLPENGELLGLSAVTLSNEESGNEPDFEQNQEHDSELLSSSFVPAAPRQATEQKAVEHKVSTTCPEMFWDCPVFLTQLSQTRDTGDSPGLSQVLVRENTHIPQYLVSQDTQDVLGIPRTVP